MKNVARYRIAFIESERGWGQRVDGYKYFPPTERGLIEAKRIRDGFNKINKEPSVPDWYMYATDPELVVVDLDNLPKR